MAYSLTILVKLLPADTGLAATLLAKIYNSSNVLRVTTSAGVGWTELANGEYQFTYANYDTTDAYVLFYNGSTYETGTAVTAPAISDLTGIATTTNVSDAVSAIELHGDANWETATGFATPTNISDAVSAIETYGGTAPWTTASGFSTPGDITDAVTDIEEYGDENWITTGFSTPLDIINAVTEIEEYGDENWTTATGFSTPTDITTAENNIVSAIEDSTEIIVNEIISESEEGSGIIQVPITLKDVDDNVLDGVFVEIKSGVTKVAAGYTDSNGTVTFYLDAGIYNMYRQLAGYTFTNPVEIEVTETQIIIRYPEDEQVVNAYPITVTDAFNVPIEGVFVQIKTGVVVIAAGYTNAQGNVTFWLSSGTYKMYRAKDGYTFTNPVTITVA